MYMHIEYTAIRSFHYYFQLLFNVSFITIVYMVTTVLYRMCCFVEYIIYLITSDSLTYIEFAITSHADL